MKEEEEKKNVNCQLKLKFKLAHRLASIRAPETRLRRAIKSPLLFFILSLFSTLSLSMQPVCFIALIYNDLDE